GQIHVGGEVPRPHRDRWNKRRGLQGSLPCGRTLITGEEEDPVFLYRPADRSSELVTFQLIVLWSESVARVKRRVAYEPKRIAVKQVCSGLRNCVHRSRRVTSVGCILSAGDNFEFLESVREGKRHVRSDIVVQMRGAVEVVLHAVARSTRHANVYAGVHRSEEHTSELQSHS